MGIYYDVIVFPCSLLKTSKLKFKVCGLLGNIIFSPSDWQKLPEPPASKRFHTLSHTQLPKNSETKQLKGPIWNLGPSKNYLYHGRKSRAPRRQVDLA